MTIAPKILKNYPDLQRIAYDLLADKTLRDDLTGDIRYVLVDEYPDTNTVQEQLLLKLTEHSGDLCVVGERTRASTGSGVPRCATSSNFHHGLSGARSSS
ncbi:MAG: UvrD-helicase domain-containing protein [Desulfobacterales bacterium]